MLDSRQKNYIKNLSKKIADQPVRIFPWDSQGLDIAQAIIKEIKSADPELKIFLRGSLPLKIAGQKDIDLTAEAPALQFGLHCQKLAKAFGQPVKINQDSLVWHFIKQEYAVGIYIVDPDKSDQLQRQNKFHNIFQNNPSLLAKYEQLKLSLNGLPYRVYLEKKFEFLNKIDCA